MENSSIALVASKGGHLGQVKIIFDRETIGNRKAILVTETSEKIKEPKEEMREYKTYFFRKDSLGFNALRYLEVFLKMRRVFMKEGIDIVISTGGHIAMPAFLAAKSLGAKTVFIDTVIRVKTPNWSARACYPMSDVFLVQHESMAGKYGKKAVYAGGIL